MYELNIRTFNANDKNGNGIIENGEEKGNFINASKRLNELANSGINTVKILPVLPVSKTHAIGTAGSLFAPSEFNKINPQLKKNNAYEEMRNFINECHKKNMRVVVDLPAYAGYDLYRRNPNLFLKDNSGKPIAPNGQKDVLILDAGKENSINPQVYKLYEDFIKMMLDLSVDGIAVSMPETKPYSFWHKLITKTREYDSEMLFLAQTNPKDTNVDKLLEAGFDGYTGYYKNIQDIHSELYETIKNDISQKNVAVTANYASYDVVNPTIKHGANYSKQLIWIYATLPLNISYVDGFSTGDNYMYPLSNKKASSSLTDDNMYTMKRGMLDIYNFSRKPEGSDFDIYSEFVMANKTKTFFAEPISKGIFSILKTSNPNVISYARCYNKVTIILIANTSTSKIEKVKIKVPKINADTYVVPMKVSTNIPLIKKGEVIMDLDPLETQALLIQNFDIK
jgi:hypothetical protein